MKEFKEFLIKALEAVGGMVILFAGITLALFVAADNFAAGILVAVLSVSLGLGLIAKAGGYEVQ